MSDAGKAVGYILVFWIVPAIILFGVLTVIIDNVIGKAVFLCDGAESRYSNRRLILIFAFWTLPLAAITKLVVG